MTLTERLRESVRACFTGLWIESHEHHDALLEIQQLCSQEGWQLATWDIDQGLFAPGAGTGAATDPLSAIRVLGSLAQPEGTTLLVLQNFHRFLQGYAVEAAKQEARRQGYGVIEQPLADGSIRLTVQIGG